MINCEGIFLFVVSHVCACVYCSSHMCTLEMSADADVINLLPTQTYARVTSPHRAYNCTPVKPAGDSEYHNKTQ